MSEKTRIRVTIAALDLERGTMVEGTAFTDIENAPPPTPANLNDLAQVIADRIREVYSATEDPPR